MKNFNQMMKQVKKMQAQMEKAQEELAQRTFEGTAGGGVVTVIVNGKKEVLQVVDPTGSGRSGRCGNVAGFDHGGGQRCAEKSR